jgi:hypothetical protein
MEKKRQKAWVLLALISIARSTLAQSTDRQSGPETPQQAKEEAQKLDANASDLDLAGGRAAAMCGPSRSAVESEKLLSLGFRRSISRPHFTVIQ